MIWWLLVIYQVKHFVADYPLQGTYMLGKFKKEGWILPLLSHALVHGMFTFAIAMFYLGLRESIMLAVFDTAVHFAVDRIKASPELLGRFKALTKKDFEDYHHIINDKNLNKSHPQEVEKLKLQWPKRLKSNTYFWWSLGIDKMAHHLTHYLIIYAIVTN